MPRSGCPLFNMPNGYPFWSQCHFCLQWDLCHGRGDEDFAFWVGTWCNTCLDWIEADEDSWAIFHARNYRFHHTAGLLLCCCRDHPLVDMARTEAATSLIAEFLLRPAP